MASGGDGGAPKAVAFALKGSAKARPTVAVNGGGGPAARDFVTAMGDGALDSVAPQQRQAGPLVIPALANTFETGVGKRPRGVRSLLCLAHALLYPPAATLRPALAARLRMPHRMALRCTCLRLRFRCL
jgi:hypothetical protein